MSTAQNGFLPSIHICHDKCDIGSPISISSWPSVALLILPLGTSQISSLTLLPPPWRKPLPSCHWAALTALLLPLLLLCHLLSTQEPGWSFLCSPVGLCCSFSSLCSLDKGPVTRFLALSAASLRIPCTSHTDDFRPLNTSRVLNRGSPCLLPIPPYSVVLSPSVPSAEKVSKPLHLLCPPHSYYSPFSCLHSSITICLRSGNQ